jgi:protein disulfide-isomerase
MKIKVWSDYICPFFYIGKRKLEQALASFPHKDKVDIQFKAFELDANASYEATLNIHEAIAPKYGTTVEEAGNKNLQTQGEANNSGAVCSDDSCNVQN